MSATETTGQIIKKLREAQGMTQNDLAKKMHISRQIISYYETDTRMPNVDDIKFLAEQFNTTTDYLLGLTPNTTKDPEVTAICKYTGLSDDAVNNLHELSLSKSWGNTTTAFVSADGRIKRTSPAGFALDFINEIVLCSDFSESAFFESVHHVYNYIHNLKFTAESAETALHFIPKADIGLISMFEMGDPHSHSHKEISACVETEKQFKIAMSEYYQAVKAFEKCIDIFCINEKVNCDESMKVLREKIEERKAELRERELNGDNS